MAPLVAASCGLTLAACSSGSSTPSTTVAPGVAVLGAPFSVWVRGHPAVSAGGESGYGDVVTVDGQSVPQITGVKQLEGRVVSLHLAMPDGTRLGRAEALVRAQLPADARQTASWRGTFPGTPTSYCEFVDYQSTRLATSLGVPPPAGSAPNIGTSLYERAGGRSGTSSIAKVNQADISTAANVLGTSC